MIEVGEMRQVGFSIEALSVLYLESLAPVLLTKYKSRWVAFFVNFFQKNFFFN